MNFKKWLNEVAVLYHGTRNKFDDLKPNKARFGTGISLTDNPQIAFNYALGKYKGGKTSGEPIVKKINYNGRSFNFFEKVSDDVVKEVLKQLDSYIEEFTSDKKRIFLKSINSSWKINGEIFYKEIQRAFAKKGTNEECKLAKSRNKNLDVCSSCSVFGEMPNFLNRILNNIGFDSLCYNDVNDGISHRCYFLIR